MRAKLLTLLLGVLVLTQIILYTQIKKSNIEIWNRAQKNLEDRIKEQNDRIVQAKTEVSRLQKIKDNVPKAILEGVEDPESKFVGFMDYISRSILYEMNGSFSITEKQTIKYKPVPLQETEFEFQFSFTSPEKLEAFFDYLLNQQKEYPLKVRLLDIKRVPAGPPQVYLRVSLLLPAKIKSNGGKSATPEGRPIG